MSLLYPILIRTQKLFVWLLWFKSFLEREGGREGGRGKKLWSTCLAFLIDGPQNHKVVRNNLLKQFLLNILNQYYFQGTSFVLQHHRTILTFWPTLGILQRREINSFWEFSHQSEHKCQYGYAIDILKNIEIEILWMKENIAELCQVHQNVCKSKYKYFSKSTCTCKYKYTKFKMYFNPHTSTL